MTNEPPKVPARRDRRREASQRPTDIRKRRLALGVIGVMLLMIAGVLIAGYVIIFVLPPQRVVVRVNDVKYTRGDMVTLLRARQTEVELQGEQFNSTADMFQALHALVENEIIEQSAPKFGITVSDDQVEERMLDLLAPTLVREVEDQDQLDREFSERMTEYLNTRQVSEAEYRQAVRQSMLRTMVREFIGESVPLVAEQVHLHRIVMSSQDETQVMQLMYNDVASDSKDAERLQAVFKQIARRFSGGDPETVRVGGDLGWVTRGIYEDYEDIFFELDVGQMSEPLPDFDSQENFIFFMVSEKSPAREIDEDDREVMKRQALQDWLNKERANYDVYSRFNSDIYAWMLKQLKLSSSSTPEPLPDQFGPS